MSYSDNTKVAIVHGILGNGPYAEAHYHLSVPFWNMTRERSVRSMLDRLVERNWDELESRLQIEETQRPYCPSGTRKDQRVVIYNAGLIVPRLNLDAGLLGFGRTAKLECVVLERRPITQYIDFKTSTYFSLREQLQIDMLPFDVRKKVRGQFREKSWPIPRPVIAAQLLDPVDPQ